MTETVRGADALISIIERLGTNFIFGLPGSANLPIYDALYEKARVRSVLTRHEEAASFMADAYARVTGKIGVCTATVGPGATNLIIGVAASYMDSIPVLALTGNIRTKFFNRGAQQDIDHVGLFKPVTKWSTQVRSPERIPSVMRRAVRILRSPRPGPVHLNLPIDVLRSTFDFDTEQPLPKPQPPLRTRNPERIRAAASLLAESRRPVILGGGGVIASDASEELTHLAETLNCPVATSYNGRGSIPEDHALSLGRIGQFTPAAVNDLVRESDALLAVGFRFTDVSTNNWTVPGPGAKIVQIDVDASEIGRNFPVAVGIIGDARDALQRLCEELKGAKISPRSRQAWLRHVQESKSGWRRRAETKANSGSVPIKPQRAMKELRSALDRDAIVTAEAGFCKEWASTLLEIYKPRTWIHPAGFTPMGYSLCAAVGAKLAKPETQVVAVTGDGAFQMVSHEIATARENNAPVLIFLLNDSSYGMIRYLQKRDYGERLIATEFAKTPDFVKIAEAYGGAGLRVERPSELAEGIRAGLDSDVPFLLDIAIDRDEVPGLT
jgi:acetolactate synthase-1/2/3 large subunit